MDSIPMPSLVHGEARAQQPLSSPPLLENRLPGGEPWTVIHRQDNGYLVRFSQLADFEISGSGMQVVVHAVPGVCAHTVEHLYQNQALPLALSLQKKLVLHGSAVAINGQAVAFVAASGRGKSTLAASFSSSGFAFLTDDSLNIDKSADGYVIRPGHPSIRLWSDSCEALAHPSSRTAPRIDYSPKVRILADETLPFCQHDRALGYVYFLGDGSSEHLAITPMSGQQSVIGMIRHCFLLGVDERDMLAHNFRQLAELSRSPVFFTLDYPRRYDTLDRVREAVVAHVLQGVIPAPDAPCRAKR